MRAYFDRNGKSLLLIQVLFIYAWLMNLLQTDAYFSVYILCAILGLGCVFDNYKKNSVFPTKIRILIDVFAALFSLATVLANYPLFEPITAMLSLFNAGCSFLGGFFVGVNILIFLLNKAPVIVDPSARKHPVRFFFVTFLTIAAIDLLYLFFAAYPGVLTKDAVSTVTQLVSGVYNNTMPFWHTVTVKLFYEIGFSIFEDGNAAVAFFHCFQILFIAACFAYALVTLYQVGVPKWCLAVFYGIYALAPYNIAYSSTMWKDVLFSAAGLLMITAFYRILKKIGKAQVWNYVIFTLGAVGFSLMRTNGWYAFLVVTLIMLFLLRKHYKKLLVLMSAVLILCWILINPVLALMNVGETDLMEAFGIPFQQIARVIAEERALTDEETALLSEAFSLDDVKELYTPGTVDPIKFQTFRHDNRAYVEAHLGEYIKLYLTLGLRYPGEYLKAWIEETKGYWNGGYEYWIYTTGVEENDYGIVWSGGSNIISRLFGALFRYLEKPEILQPLYSIGLRVWIVIACCLINVLKKKKEFLLTIPLLVLVVGLWLGTPVYAEFRYAYPVFTAVPVILSATLFDTVEKKQ